METSLRKDRLLLAQNYALYYGYGHGDLLSRFDVAVIEPKGQRITEIAHLKERNTLVISYLSIIEVRPDEPIFQLLDEDDFLSINGMKVENKQFGTYFVNLQSEVWIQYLLREIYHQYMINGVDGIFMDTIGNIDGYPEGFRHTQLKAVANLLYVIKLLYPKHLLIQNNGLEYVYQETCYYIDGICWENPPLLLEESKEWVDVIKNRLEQLKDCFNLKVMLLIEETLDEDRKVYLKSRKMAKDSGFLLYNAPHNYVNGVNVLKG
jgi:hypothetical protein